MPVVNINGIRTNYIQLDCLAGEDCEDLVMVHGLATNLAFWYFQHAPEFSKRYRITLYDLRGHGQSDMADQGYTSRNMAVDLCQLLDCLEIDRAHFVAHSFGGTVALNLACMNQDRLSSLVLLDTHISAIRRQTANKWEYGKKIQSLLDRHGLNLNVNEPYFGYRMLTKIAQIQEENDPLPPALKDLFATFMGKYSKRTAGKWLKLLKTTNAEKELMEDDSLSLNHLRKLKLPILALYGEHSQAMLTGKQLPGIWPHANFKCISSAGHFFPLTRPAELMAHCQKFWNDLSMNKTHEESLTLF